MRLSVQMREEKEKKKKNAVTSSLLAFPVYKFLQSASWKTCGQIKQTIASLCNSHFFDFILFILTSRERNDTERKETLYENDRPEMSRCVRLQKQKSTDLTFKWACRSMIMCGIKKNNKIIRQATTAKMNVGINSTKIQKIN